jgi:hypothetical protein
MGLPYTTVVPASLRDNYKKEREKFTDQPQPPLNLVSYTQAGTGKLEDKPPEVIHVDEAHRLTSPGAAGAATRDAIEKAKHVLLMTGTPIKNDPAEFVHFYNALTNKHVSPNEFASRYLGEETVYPGGILGRILGQPALHRPAIKHEEELASDLKGKVDYYSAKEPPATVEEEEVVTELEPQQASLYKAMFGKLPWILRQKLRMNYPLTSTELHKARAFLTGPRQVSLSDLGYKRDGDPYAAYTRSSKLQTAHQKLQETLNADKRTRAVVYSNFITAGLVPYAAALERAGIPYGMFHGGIPPKERQRMVEDFNKGNLRVALLGPAGSEGISLKGAQLVQILDEHWNEPKTQQAIARAIRYDSHSDLPPELQRVKVQRFRARVPPGVIGQLMRRVGISVDPEPGTDDYLAHMSSNKLDATAPLLQLLQRVSKEAIDFSQIKALSDNRDYAAKAYALREKIKKNPDQWIIDSKDHYKLGLTHVPTGWRFHLPIHTISDLLPLIAEPTGKQ